MLFDQPRDQFGVGCVEAKTRAQSARYLGARNRMILWPALCNVMKQCGDVNDGPVFGKNLAHQLAGESDLVIVAALDILKYADAANQMLVHRVVMVHVEL